MAEEEEVTVVDGKELGRIETQGFSERDLKLIKAVANPDEPPNVLPKHWQKFMERGEETPVVVMVDRIRNIKANGILVNTSNDRERDLTNYDVVYEAHSPHFKRARILRIPLGRMRIDEIALAGEAFPPMPRGTFMKSDVLISDSPEEAGLTTEALAWMRQGQMPKQAETSSPSAQEEKPKKRRGRPPKQKEGDSGEPTGG